MATRKEQIALIENAFSVLDDFFELTEHRTKWQGEYQNLIKASEQQHRRGTLGPNNMPMDKACKYFAVKWVFDSFRLPNYCNILTSRAEAVLGNALGKEYREKILELFTKKEIKAWLDSVQYQELN